MPPQFVTIPRRWPDSTIVCIGSGPSLLLDDVLHVCAWRAEDPATRAVIAINDTFQLARWADVLYAADAKWWRWHQDVPDASMPPVKYTIDPHAQHWRPSVQVINYSGHRGFDPSPASIRTGGHSGYQAIHVAAHLGASTIILLGYDMQPAADGRNHYFGEHPDGNHPKYAHRLSVYSTLVEPLRQRQITVINASRQTAITDFPCSPIDALLTLRQPLVAHG